MDAMSLKVVKIVNSSSDAMKPGPTVRSAVINQ